MNVTNGTGTAYPSGAPEFIPVLVGFVFLGLLFSVKCFVDRCLSFCTFLLVIVSSAFPRYTDSDYPFGIYLQTLLRTLLKTGGELR
jgi:hypothetical protein